MAEEPKKSKKNPNLAALLGEGSNKIEQTITKEAIKPENTANEPPVLTQEQKSSEDLDEVVFRKEEAKSSLEQELGLPKSFVRVFLKNPSYEKATRTNTLVNKDILERYKQISSAMDVDTVVLVNNVLAEWFNKHLETAEKVVYRKAVVKAL